MWNLLFWLIVIVATLFSYLVVSTLNRMKGDPRARRWRDSEMETLLDRIR